MRTILRSRSPSRRVHRPALRAVGRGTWHSPVRLASHWASRQVLPYSGPSLRSIVALFNAYYRLALKHEKQRNPGSRFKTLGTPEERQRKAEEDLQRIYGQPLAPTPAPTPVPVSSAPAKPVQLPPDKASQAPPAPPKAKADVMAVPLVKLSSGCWRLDWSRAHPAT